MPRLRGQNVVFRGPLCAVAGGTPLDGPGSRGRAVGHAGPESFPREGSLVDSTQVRMVESPMVFLSVRGTMIVYMVSDDSTGVCPLSVTGGLR